MKKYYIAIFLLLLICIIPHKTTLTAIASEQGRGEYAFIVDGKEQKGAFTKRFVNGDTTILYCNAYMACDMKKGIQNQILGESYSFTGDREDALDFIKKLQGKIVKESKTGEILSYYVYAGSLDSQAIDIGGKRVNMQIALQNGKIEVGIPIILGSY